MTESHEHRLKRLYMRSIRRGIKEMDLILTAFADQKLSGLSEADLDLYDALLHENDQDLYQWVTGQAPAPDQFKSIISSISENHGVAKPA